MQARYFKISPLFHLLPNRRFSFESGVRAPDSQCGDAFGLCEAQRHYQGGSSEPAKGSITLSNYRYTPQMSGTCHTSSTFESAVFINILVHLPVQQGMGLSWKHPQGALEDLRARGAAWLALPPPASADVLTNTKLLWSHPGFAVFDGKSSGSDLPAAIWAPACPASSGGKEKRAAVTLLAKLNPSLFPHLWHRANQCKPTLKMQLILWRLSRFLPRKVGCAGIF